MMMTMTDEYKIEDGGIWVELPVEALAGILEEYPDITVRLQK
jgi:hypothetical protein